MLKNATVQWRQKKTNCCQIALPIFFMTLLGIFSLAFNKTSDIPPTLEFPTIYNARNSTYNCTLNGVESECGKYNHLYFVNPPSGETAGSLTNSTSGEGKSGLLGRIPQMPYVPVNPGVPETEVLVPFFEEWESASQVDEEIFNLLGQRQQNISVMWEMPTGVMLFNQIQTSNTSAQQINYVLQLQEQPYGPISNLNGSQSQMYPNNTDRKSVV